MIITYHGKQCFKIQVGDTVLAYNPPSKDSKHKPARFGADIALISMDHSDFNGAEQVAYGNKEPFVISGPGEYETKGIFVKGFLVESQYDKKEKLNTIYLVTMDNLNLCFLGSLHSGEIDPKTKESLSNIDVLFVPAGSGDTLSPADAQKLSNKLSPGIIIPMDYDIKTLKEFLKEAGSESTKAVEKLTIKKKEVEGKEGEVVVLEAQ